MCKAADLDNGVTHISAGSRHSCAIQNDAAFCWGSGSSGRLGRGGAENSDTPVAVTGLDSDVTDISAGDNHTCAVQDGAAFCWGDGSFGKLGRGNTENSNIPVAVTDLGSGVTDISAGNRHTCAVHNGAVKCWGVQFRGALGNGVSSSDISLNTPVNVSDVTSGFTNNNITSITTGGQDSNGISCAVQNGAAFCWGYGGRGERGDGTTKITQTTAVQVTGLSSGVTSLDLGFGHACAVHNNLFKCWGRQANGRLGDGVTPTDDEDTAQASAVDITTRFP